MTTTNTVLQRKLASARNDAPTGGRSALRALRRALPKAAADAADMALSVTGGTQDRILREDIAGRIGDDGALLVLLDGAAGQTGAIWLDRAIVAAIVEQQTTGRISTRPPPDRPCTSTDAALAAPLIDALLSLVEDLVEVAADRACLTGYRFGARVEDAAAVVLAVEADRLRVFTLGVAVAEGTVQGAITLALPEAPAAPEADGPDAREKSAATARGMQTFGTIRAELTAAICRLHLPLEMVATLQVGDRLDLPDTRLDMTELVTIAGASAGMGQLGQSGGFRAVRLVDRDPRTSHTRPVPDEPFTADVAQMVNGGAAGAKHEPVAEDPDMQPPAVYSEDDDSRLETLPTDLAVAEISELAGLPLDGEETSLSELQAAMGAMSPANTP